MIWHFDVIPLLEPGNDEMLLKNAWNTLFFCAQEEWLAAQCDTTELTASDLGTGPSQ